MTQQALAVFGAALSTTTVATAATPANTAPVAPTQPTQPTTQATPVEPFITAKVRGQERAFTKEEAARLLSRVGSADDVVKQTKAWRAEREKELADLKARDAIWDDDEKLEAELAKRGKLDKLAVKRVQQKYDETQLTPEQKEAKAASERAEAAEKRLKDLEAEQAQARVHQGAKIRQQQMETMLADAATRAGRKLPDPDLLVALHGVMGEWGEVGLLDPKQPFTPETADALVDAANGKIEEAKAEFRSTIVAKLEGQALEDFIGSENIDRAIKYRIELRRNGGKPVATAPAPVVPRAGPGPEYKSPQQLREEREARLRG